jgi:hypothetical protein
MWHEKPKDLHFVKVGNTYVQLERVYRGEKYNAEMLMIPIVVLFVLGVFFIYVTG